MASGFLAISLVHSFQSVHAPGNLDFYFHFIVLTHSTLSAFRFQFFHIFSFTHSCSFFKWNKNFKLLQNSRRLRLWYRNEHKQTKSICFRSLIEFINHYCPSSHSFAILYTERCSKVARQIYESCKSFQTKLIVQFHFEWTSRSHQNSNTAKTNKIYRNGNRLWNIFGWKNFI